MFLYKIWFCNLGVSHRNLGSDGLFIKVFELHKWLSDLCYFPFNLVDLWHAIFLIFLLKYVCKSTGPFFFAIWEHYLKQIYMWAFNIVGRCWIGCLRFVDHENKRNVFVFSSKKLGIFVLFLSLFVLKYCWQVKKSA